MDNIVFGVWVSGRLEFSDDDKRACFETAETIVEIAQDVRRHGLLSIDEKIPAMPDFFMARALQFAVDATEEEKLKEIMQNWIIFGNYRGAELLKRLISLKGVMMIVDGCNPNQIKETLLLFCGEDFLREHMAKRKEESSYLMVVREKDAKAAQERILAKVKELEQRGEIRIAEV